MRSMLVTTIGYSLLFGAAVIATSLVQPRSQTPGGAPFEPASMSRDAADGHGTQATLPDMRATHAAVPGG